MAGGSNDSAHPNDAEWAAVRWRRAWWLWGVTAALLVIAFAVADIAWSLVGLILSLACVPTIVAVWQSPARTSIRTAATAIAGFALLGAATRLAFRLPLSAFYAFYDALTRPVPFERWNPRHYVLVCLMAAVIAWCLCRFTPPRPRPAPLPARATPVAANLVPVVVPPSTPGEQPRVAYVPAPPRTNTCAILALVFGILGGSVVAVVLGHVALSQIRRTGDQGRGMAIAGLVLGYFWIAVVIAYVVALGAFLNSL